MKLRIEGKEIDLTESVVAITRQAFNFFNLGINLIDRSNQFSVPKNQKNKQILDNPEILNSNKLQFEKKFTGQLIDSGVILLDGTGYLTESSDNYSFQLTDGCRELFDLLNVSMRSLSLDDEDFDWIDMTNKYNATYRTLNSSVWLWAINIQRTDSTSWEATPLDFDLNLHRPGFAVIRLIEKIEQFTGWTFNYNGATWDLFESLFLTSNHKDFLVSSYQKTQSGTISGDTDLTLSSYDFKESSVTASTYYIDIHSQVAKLRIRGNVSATESFYVVVKSVITSDTTKNKTERFFFNSSTTEINILTSEFNQAANNQISVTIETDGDVTFDDCLIYTVISESDIASINPVGFRVKTYENIDDISILSFIKNIFNLTGSFFVGNYTKKIVEMYNYLSFNKLNVEDWSSKFIEEGFTIYSSDDISKKNYFTYDNDDTLTTDDGSSYFTCDSENLKNEDNVLEISLSASKDFVLNTGDWYEYIGTPNYEQTVAYLPIYKSTTERFELDSRILSYYEKIMTKGWPVPTDSMVSTFASFYQLDFKTLISSVYKEIALALKKPRILEAYFMLSRKDVLFFNFTKQVYIDYFKSNFFVQEISNFIPGQKTKVILIRKGDE